MLSGHFRQKAGLARKKADPRLKGCIIFKNGYI